MGHTFKGNITEVKDSSLLWNYRIVLPAEIIAHFIGTDKRVICTVNGSDPLHCALISNGKGAYFIMTNEGFRKKWKINAGDEVLVSIKKDDSKYGMFVPDFFEELCFQDPEADTFFHELTPGKQRSLLHLIAKVKSENKQLEKALIVFDYLKRSEGKLDFKELNEAFKNSRFKK